MTIKELTAVTLLILIMAGLSMNMGPGSSGLRHQYIQQWVHQDILPRIIPDDPAAIPARGTEPSSGCEFQRINPDQLMQSATQQSSQLIFLPEAGIYEMILPLLGSGDFLKLRFPRQVAEAHVPFLQWKKFLILLVVAVLGLAAVVGVSWAVRESQKTIIAKERAEVLQRLARGLAHEIRNPLNALGLSARMLSEATGPDGDRQRYARMLRTEINRLDSILQHFSDWSTEVHPERAEIDLRKLLQQVSEVFQVEAANRGIRLFLSDGPPALLSVDEGMIRQILVNLVKNGLEASPDQASLRMGLQIHRHQLEITIQDAGPGIPPEDHGKIFEYYYTTRPSGQGIGLALAQKLAQAHGGRITVDSRPGHTVFTLQLPVKGNA